MFDFFFLFLLQKIRDLIFLDESNFDWVPKIWKVFGCMYALSKLER